jgi:hypothetical protein
MTTLKRAKTNKKVSNHTFCQLSPETFGYALTNGLFHYWCYTGNKNNQLPLLPFIVTSLACNILLISLRELHKSCFFQESSNFGKYKQVSWCKTKKCQTQLHYTAMKALQVAMWSICLSTTFQNKLCPHPSLFRILINNATTCLAVTCNPPPSWHHSTGSNQLIHFWNCVPGWIEDSLPFLLSTTTSSQPFPKSFIRDIHESQAPGCLEDCIF